MHFQLAKFCTTSTYIISLGGRPFHPSVPSSVHPSSSSRKKKMMEEEEDEWRHQHFIQIFMCSAEVCFLFPNFKPTSNQTKIQNFLKIIFKHIKKTRIFSQKNIEAH
jgi:hypothetical protein